MTPASLQGPGSTLGRELLGKVARGSLWVVGGRVSTALLRLASNIIIARLLFPEAFGLMGLVSVFITGIELFSDTGIGPSIIRSKRGDDPVFLRTAWTVQVIRGVLLYLVCLILASPYAAIYEEPELARMLSWAGLVSVLNGIRSPEWYVADRKFMQGRKVLIDLASHFVGISVMIGWALFDRSVDALLAGSLSTALTHTVASNLMFSSRSMKLHLDRSALIELIGFGRWIFISTAATFLALQGDRLALGYLVALGPLGVFFVASRIVDLATTMLHSIVESVIFPAWMESARRDEEHHVSRMQRSRSIVLTVGLSSLVLIVGLAPTLFRLLYDSRYGTAAIYAQAMCVPAWFLLLKNSAAKAVLVHGNSRAQAISNIVQLTVKLPASLLGHYWLGLHGFILFGSLGIVAGLGVLYPVLREYRSSLGKHDAKATVRFFALAGSAAAVSYFVRDAGNIAATAVECAATTVLVVIAAYPLLRAMKGVQR